MITICFYLEQREPTGPDLTKWFAIRDEFGVALVGICWRDFVANIDTDSIPQFPSLSSVMASYRDYRHVFLQEGMGKPLAEFTHPEDNVVYFIGRNSQGFRDDLVPGEGGTWVNVPGGDLWAHEAARILMNSRVT